MFDPYLHDTPSVSDPANDLILLTPSASVDIPVGIKGLRIYNPLETPADVVVITVLGRTVTFSVPARTCSIEPLRITRLLNTTTSGIAVHGYTDSVA